MEGVKGLGYLQDEDVVFLLCSMEFSCEQRVRLISSPLLFFVCTASALPSALPLVFYSNPAPGQLNATFSFRCVETTWQQPRYPR